MTRAYPLGKSSLGDAGISRRGVDADGELPALHEDSGRNRSGLPSTVCSNAKHMVEHSHRNGCLHRRLCMGFRALFSYSKLHPWKRTEHACSVPCVPHAYAFILRSARHLGKLGLEHFRLDPAFRQLLHKPRFRHAVSCTAVHRDGNAGLPKPQTQEAKPKN